MTNARSREWLNLPKLCLGVDSGGVLEITITSGTSMYIETAKLWDGQRRVEHYLIVRNLPYHISAHVYLWSDGAWHVGREGESRYTSLYVTRGDRFMTDASRSARDKIAKIVCAAAEQAAKDHPQRLGEADYVSRNNSAFHIEDKIVRHEMELAELRLELAGLGV